MAKKELKTGQGVYEQKGQKPNKLKELVKKLWPGKKA